MKPFLGPALLLILLMMLPASLVAETLRPGSDEPSQLQLTLNNYKANGFEMLGPVQYLGKTGKKIKLYKNPPVSYGALKVADEADRPCRLDIQDFVYVLSKDAQVILIRVDREDRDNA